MNFDKLPKIELHLHLDCSLSYEVVRQLDPAISREEYAQSFRAGGRCHSLQDYLEKAVRGFALMQDEKALELVTLDLFDQLKADGVLYAEIRFAPFLHIHDGLTATEVVEIVDRTINKGRQKTGVEASLILCTLRHFSASQSMETVRLVEAFRGNNVVGFDIAADEAGYPIHEHRAAFRYAKESGLHITAHAGEACGPPSVWETLTHFFPSRIGHGVRSVEDPLLMEHLKRENIHLEVCPTSNIHTGIYPSVKEHPADLIYKSGISMSINTDGRTISNVTLTDEYEKLHQAFGWGETEIIQCNLNAINAAFISEDKKQKLKDQFLEIWKKR